MHFTSEGVDFVYGLAANCEGRVHDEDLEGRFVNDLKPSVVLDSRIWLANPSGERIAILVDVSASHEERSRSKNDVPAEDLRKGQQEGSEDTS